MRYLFGGKKQTKKNKHLCSQCCLPFGRVQRQWARSEPRSAGPDRESIRKQSLNIKPDKVHQACLRWLHWFQMSLFSQMRWCSEDLSPYSLSRLRALVLPTGLLKVWPQHTSMSISPMWLNLLLTCTEITAAVYHKHWGSTPVMEIYSTYCFKANWGEGVLFVIRKLDTLILAKMDVGLILRWFHWFC